MKKRIISAVLICTLALSLTACNKNSDAADNTATSAGSTTSLNYAEQLAKDKENYGKYVSLGEYKNFEVDVDRSTLEITDEQVNSYIDGIRTARAEANEVNSGTTKTGDTIKLDYSGTLDGVAFSGGTATDAQYEVGSGRFISDLDKGLIGLEVGKEYDIPCRFPDDYNQSDLAGKDVIFKVKVTAIIENILPEYNDEFVKTIVSSGAYETTAQTADEFTKYVQEELKSEAQSAFDSSKYEAIWNKISETSSVSGYPEEELTAVTNTVIENVKTEFSYYGSYYNITTFEDYVKQVYQFENEAAFNEYAKEYAQNYLKEKMILTMIAQKENIEVTDDEVKTYGETIASENGYDSYQAIIDQFGDDITFEVGYSVLADKVTGLLLNSVTEK